MGLNFRKSVKIADGVKLNIGKKSAGVSVGGKYAGASFNTKSGARVRASLPGTGISYTKSLNSVGKKRASKKKSKNTLATVLTVLIVLIAVIFLINKNWTKISETLGLNQTVVESGTSQSGASSDASAGTAISYVINTSTKKIHITTCRYADTTSANIEETSASLEELLADGYSKCGTCMD
jgi:hypothetical protein